MTKIKTKIENSFERSGRFFYTHAKLVIVLLFIFIAVIAWQIPNMALDHSVEGTLDPDHQTRINYNEFRDQFGRAEVIIVTAESDDIFSPEFFKNLRDLTLDLSENVPFISDVTSLYNIRSTRTDGHDLVMEEFADPWPKTPADFESLKKRAKASPLYENHVLSADGRVAAVLIKTEALVADEKDAFDPFSGFDEGTGRKSGTSANYFSEKQNLEVVEAVRKIVNRHSKEGFQLVFSGGPVIMAVFNKAVFKDTILLMSLAFIAIMFFLFFLFRRLSGVIYPLLVICAALICTLGLMPVLGVTFKVTSIIIPGFLVAVGVADSVHILASFYRRLNQGADQQEAICHALGHSGLAVVMTTLTTAAGLFSFAWAELAAIAEMGIFTGIGVLFALFFTITMLPALLALFPIKPKSVQTRENVATDRMLLFFADFSTTYYKSIIIVCLVLLVVFSSFLPSLGFSNNHMDALKDELPAKKDLIAMDKRMQGALVLEAVVDMGTQGAFYEPAVLEKLEIMADRIFKIENEKIFAGKVFLINDVIKEIHQALHDGDPDFFKIPETRQMIAQEILLFENLRPDDLTSLVDTGFSKARITIKTPWADTVDMEVFMTDIRSIFEDVFADNPDARLLLTGEMALMADTVPAALRGMAKSYVIAFVVITLAMLFMLGDIKVGFIAMFPNLLPIVMVMGSIGFLGIYLNFNTLMIGCIAIGLVVDDTMHFLYNFLRQYKKSGDVHDAVRYTLLGTGRALFITSVVLCSLFLSALTASLATLNQFGLFTAIIIVLALLADFILAPALMMAVFGKKPQMD